MVQLKIILDTRRKKSDGTYPVLFRITNVKKVNYLSSGIAVFQEDWDEGTFSIVKKHPNHKSLNLALSKRYYEIQKGILKLENDNVFTIDALKDNLYPKVVAPPKIITFNEYVEKLIKQMMELNETGNALVYKHAASRFINFTGNNGIEFKEIDFNLLNAFRYQLLADGVN